ncbi:complement C1q-like protein 4 [Engraulis encrasicolus]|uniref:complement C1q-like protein 4 n=1 Tax=Engraulis encrasicolus TaxID=184585 RepID=UPI002FD48D24
MLRSMWAAPALLLMLLASLEGAVAEDPMSLTELIELVKELKAGQSSLKAELDQAKLELRTADTEHEAEIAALKRKLVDMEISKVAFSAGLTNDGEILAGSTNLNLVFSKEITNVGGAYNSVTGFFTAPIKGVYYFRFNAMDRPHSSWTNVQLFKNGQLVMSLSDKVYQGHNNISGGLALQLEVGDVVNLVLPEGKRLYDDKNNHSTFTGFQLFAL